MSLLYFFLFSSIMKRTAKIIQENRQQILDDWEKIVLKEVKASGSADMIALHDHVPNILDDIVEILSRHENIDHDIKDPKIEKIEKNSKEHGRHRAGTSHYTADQILHEYMIFHNVIIIILKRHDVKNHDIHHLIKCCIDRAMLNSVTAFTEAIDEMQNKLIGTLAHDIRNPLAAARMAIEMLNYSQGEKRLEHVKKMTFNSVNKSINMIEGLLESIRVKAGEGMALSFEETNLYHDIKTVHEEATEVYSEEIILNCDDHEIHGIYDATAIRRLMENLITNAVKYGHSNKPINVNIENSQKDHLIISVHNHGEPIPENNQLEIFQFLDRENTKENKAYKSYGIGLTLVKMVAEAHGGSVSLKSEKEHGTEFIVQLKKRSTKSGKNKTQLHENV